MAHRIKGSAGSYGFPDITRAAAVLEQAALDGPPADTLSAIAAELQDLSERARRSHRR